MLVLIRSTIAPPKNLNTNPFFMNLGMSPCALFDIIFMTKWTSITVDRFRQRRYRSVYIDPFEWNCRIESRFLVSFLSQFYDISHCFVRTRILTARAVPLADAFASPRFPLVQTLRRALWNLRVVLTPPPALHTMVLRPPHRGQLVPTEIWNDFQLAYLTITMNTLAWQHEFPVCRPRDLTAMTISFSSICHRQTHKQRRSSLLLGSTELHQRVLSPFDKCRLISWRCPYWERDGYSIRVSLTLFEQLLRVFTFHACPCEHDTKTRRTRHLWKYPWVIVVGVVNIVDVSWFHSCVGESLGDKALDELQDKGSQ